MNPTRVLIVEDDLDTAAMLRTMLHSVPDGKPEESRQSRCIFSEFETLHVATVNVAAAVLRLNPFDAILLDLYLADAEGESVVNIVCEAAPDTAIIVNSGADDRALVEKLLYNGVTDYLLKGTYSGAATLRHKICEAIEKKAVATEKGTAEVKMGERLQACSRHNFACQLQPSRYGGVAQFLL